MLSLLKRLKSDNLKGRSYLKHALGEIFLIMVGILLALQVNNWNEARKERQYEIKILSELKNGFIEDVKEIESNIINYRIAVKASDWVLQHLQSNQPYHDSLSIYMAQSIGMDAFIPQNAAYQTLKSKGVDLISNDSLRSQILYTHDFVYDFLVRYHQGTYLKPEYIIQAYTKRFEQAIPITDQNRRLHMNLLIPFNYELLKKDNEFLSILRSNRNQKFEAIRLTEDGILPLLNTIIEQVANELKIKKQ